MTKLGRLICRHQGGSRKEIRKLLKEDPAQVNGIIERDPSRLVGPFDRVEHQGRIIQARTPRYLMLNKPSGHVSATIDHQHPTVIDLIDEPWKNELHLAGRLDRFTTGLVILTNDSRFSEAMTQPDHRVPKGYKVATDTPISEEAARAFRKGIHFAKEKVITHPADIELEGERECDLTIYEGKHHQVKRMFARFGIRVTALHRYRIGEIFLDRDLAPGDYRSLNRPSF